VSTYLVLSLLGTFSLSVFAKNLASYHASQRTIDRFFAFHEAEGGLDQAIAQLRSNLAYNGQGYTGFGQGGYDVQVNIPDPAANPNLRRITVNGHAPNNVPTAYAYERRQVVAHVNFLPASSNFAVFSDTTIQMSGNAETDSYDSRLGSYQSQEPRDNGDIGTNAIQASSVTLSGNVEVGGDAIVGPQGNPSSVIHTTGNAEIEGTTSAATSPTVLNPVVVPSNLTNQGNLQLSGNTTVTLGSGTYWYSTISISGNGRLNLTGSATIYVTGNVSISGNGVVTAQNLPTNLTLNVSGAQSVSFTGNAKFYAKVYAPDSNFHLSGNGRLFGSVAADSIQQSGNAEVHYDEALSAGSGSSTTKSNLLAWVEN